MGPGIETLTEETDIVMQSVECKWHCGTRLFHDSRTSRMLEVNTGRRHDCQACKPSLSERLENIETMIRENHIAVIRELIDIRKAIRNVE